ncbi:MAG: alpha-L-glutamate ligase-like protein [Candidatus Omnitrophica bacterium]|nr:alpha-L-glutamate ligase-like protein [Candidatus Omnitrophota bacterium]
MIQFLRTFYQAGLLGMNRRNGNYTLVRNPRKLYPFVDDKLKTKELLIANGIASPELYFTIERNSELNNLSRLNMFKDFVIKPARGAAGRGIFVIVDKVGDYWKKASGELVSMEDIEYHVTNIIAGLYSLGGVSDRAFVEYRVQSHEVFLPVTFQGVPDIRMILYRGVPVMSMLRLPTKESGGRANLHQGAVGAGVDMLDGVTLGGVYHDQLIEHHPDTNVSIRGIKIPFWPELLEAAAKIYDVFKLGYVGVDFVIDQELGPLILELNARPGLNIQLANRTGLLPRLNAIDRWGGLVENLAWEKRMEISRKVIKL